MKRNELRTNIREKGDQLRSLRQNVNIVVRDLGRHRRSRLFVSRSVLGTDAFAGSAAEALCFLAGHGWSKIGDAEVPVATLRLRIEYERAVYFDRRLSSRSYQGPGGFSRAQQVENEEEFLSLSPNNGRVPPLRAEMLQGSADRPHNELWRQVGVWRCNASFECSFAHSLTYVASLHPHRDLLFVA